LSFEAWLVEQLTGTDYNIPASTASAWVEQNALALLLDGLDEVGRAHRATCAEAINEYRHRHGLVQLAVCSRTREVEDLAVRLNMEEAVELQPLTDDEVSAYLDELEGNGTPTADVRAALPADQQLREMLRSPLMLRVLWLAYQGRSATALTQAGSTDERRGELWQAYVHRMFEQRPLPGRCGYTSERAERWLIYLAGALRFASQTELRLDKLTAEWLPVHASRTGSTRRWLYLRNFLVAAERTAYPNSEVIGYGYAIFNYPEFETVRNIRSASRRIGVPVAAAAAGVVCGLAAGPLAGVAAALFAGLATRTLLPPFMWQFYARFPSRESNFLVSWAGANQGTWRAAKHGAKAGLAASVFPGSLFGFGVGVMFGPWPGFIGGLTLALLFGLLIGMFFGGLTLATHFAVRALLVRSDAAPWRYEAFLDAMTERLILRRSGTSYVFAHSLLRDHFAAFTGTDKGARRTPGQRPAV
jgi:hypothetical protein